MPRPGCVWTHSLIIRAVDLAWIEELSGLLTLFRRPVASETGRGRKLAPLSFAPTDVRCPAGEPSEFRTLLNGLYCAPDRCVLYPSVDSCSIEGAVLSVWAQQWPRLRREFIFSTGSLADRSSTMGMSFDLQVVPKDRVQRVARSNPRNLVIEAADVAHGAPEAVQFLAKEGRQPSRMFRAFLRDVGADVVSCRRAFLPLARIYQMIDSGETLEAVMDEVDVEFGPDEVRLLRHNLLAAPDEATAVAQQFSEDSRLRFLATNGDVPAVPMKDLVARARRLQRVDRLNARRLASDLLRGDLNDRSRAILEGLANAWTLEDIVQLEGESPGAAASIVHECPQFAGNPELWSALPRQESDLVEATVTAPSMSGSVAADVLHGLLVRGGETLPHGLIRAGGGLFAQALLAAVEGPTVTSGREDIPSAWVRSVSRQPEPVRTWMLQRSEPLTGLQAWLVSSACVDSPREFICIDERQWGVLLADAERYREQLAAEVAVSLLCVADEYHGPIPMRLLELSVPRLHSLLVDASLAPELWVELARRLPRPREWKAWDNAERLRRWVFDRVEDGSIFVGSLPTLSQDPESFEMFLGTATETKQGRRVLKELGIAVSDGRAQMSDAQSALLRRTVTRAQQKAEEKNTKEKKKRRHWWWEWWL